MLLFTILLASALLFVGGLADGLNQTILHHYGAFKRRFPRANDAWADPKISWMNKYAAKRPFFLVWTTDLYHLTRTVDRWCWLLTLPITLMGWRKVPAKGWKTLLVVPALAYLIRQAGFHLVYSIFFKSPAPTSNV
jgi:hypothetical protein